MPPETTSPEDPREWLRRARSNLARAKRDRDAPDILAEDACFDAQQACEKALKALLVLKACPVPRTHAIADLIDAVIALGFDPPDPVRDGASLTEYAVAARYPGPTEPVEPADLEAAVRTAEAVLTWATLMIDTHPT